MIHPLPNTALALVVVLVLALAGPTTAVTRLVATTGSDSGDCSVSPCLTLTYANGQALAADTILLAPGTYVMPPPPPAQPSVMVAVADLTITAALPATVTLQSVAAPATSTPIIGVSGAAVTGVTLSNLDFAVRAGPFVTGGGVQIKDSASVAVINCRFRMISTDAPDISNCVKFGVGVAVTTATAVVRDCTFNQLSCCSTGGGVFADAGADVEVHTSTFISNAVVGASGAGGAGVYFGSTVSSLVTAMVVANCTFTSNSVPFRNGGGIHGAGFATGTIYGSQLTSNQARNGGGIYTLGAAVTAYDLVLSSNTASAEGGGYALGIGSSLDIATSTISASVSQNGGGLYSKDAASISGRDLIFRDNESQFGAGASLLDGTGQFTFTNCRFESNRALDRGGGMLVRAQHTAVTDSVFVDNRGTSAGGAIDIQQTSQVEMAGLTMAVNIADVGAAVYTSGSSVLNVTDSVFQLGTASIGGGMYMAQQSVSRLERCVLRDNRGLSTGGSMYAADTAQIEMDNVDMLLSTTPYGGGCAFFERNAVIVMRNSRMSNCSSPSGEGGALFARQNVRLTLASMVFEDNLTGALGGAVFLSGEVIASLTNSTFRGNEAKGDGGALYMERDVVLVADDLLVEKNYSPKSGGVSVNGESRIEASRLVVRQHTLSSKSSEAPITNGGGIGCSGTATGAISDSLFEGNTVAGSGAALYTSSCVFNLTDVTVRNNDALLFGGGVHLQHESTIVGGSFEDNSARWGGGVYMLTDDAATRPSAALVGVVFARNDARGAGGGLYWEGVQPIHDPACAGCTFSANLAGGYGPDEATAASRIIILSRPPDELVAFVGSPPLSIEASLSFDVRVQVVDYYNETFQFSDPTARREMNAEVGAEAIPVGSENATVIGSNLVTIVDGFAEFTGLFLRGTRTRIPYNLVMTTTPASGVTKWEVVLEQCEAGFAEVAHPVFLFECIECPSGQFDLVRSTFCSNCPEGAICEGLTRIYALEDWWWDETSPDSKPRLYYCIPNRCCPVSQPGNRCQRSRPCADGWNQTSTLCSRCEDGKYEWNNECIPCDGTESWRFFLVFVICCAFVALLFGFGSKLGGEMRIFIFSSRPRRW
ncbi:uncharacterized protein AMSG_11742 [Thecamonas trahens ATCC 50062]|uniref:Right handed beta helix domain-containing protein n=1 Tax=Thecamonas trahens ATCC 50062 TaxID=461836 RepID=A0A0L0D357_THETB|nr:hypothetical protein AMSG_11742 [Thecamonas trahens ATCC 50062]KNC46606.1 hypothetical protein AMSG_11742 [Thecamonas trahens ATCC 50062]|eukprot:XP_013760491.1 hypothetical protein AMSG_11742 [Thecamonas trahens ATCC 50062]